MTGEYEDVRRKLEQRGYLNGPVERFVLGGIDSDARAFRLARASAKAALIGGPILGALLAGGVLAANAPILAAADGPVLWIYFSLLSAVGLFVLDVTAGAVTAALAERRGVRPADSARASLLVGLPTLAYAALLWWSRPSSPGLWAEIIFFVAALTTTLAVAWLGGLVSLAGIIGRTGQVPDRARRPIFRVALVLIPIAAILLFLHASERGAGSHGAVAASSFALAPSGAPLVFVGVDGLDAGILEEFEAAGFVRALLSSFSRGAVYPLRRSPSREPAEVWTTLLSGMGVDAHGVAGAGSERLPGVATPLRPDTGPRPLRALMRFALPTRTVPATGAFRRVRLNWEIAGLKEPIAAVGWWASWPAPEEDQRDPSGYVVTDRVLPKLLADAGGDRDTFPGALYARLRSEFDAERDSLRREFDTRFQRVDDPEVLRIAWESFLIDGWNEAASRFVLQDRSVRALFIYLPGADILRTRFRGLASNERGLRAQAAAVGAYVGWLDAVVDRLSARDPEWRVVVVGDPGRSATTGSEGFVHLAGAGVRPGCVGAPVADVDVAPLTLELMGIPSSRELRGSSPRDCRTPTPLPAVATFGRKGVPRRAPTGSEDPEILERLRSLGYVR